MVTALKVDEFVREYRDKIKVIKCMRDDKINI